MLDKIKSFFISNKAIAIKISYVVILLCAVIFSVSWIKDIVHKKQLQHKQEQIQQLETQLSSALRERDQLKKDTDAKIADFEIKLKIANNAHAAAQGVINTRPPKPVTTTASVTMQSEDCQVLLTNQYNEFVKREDILIADIDSSRTALDAANKALDAAKVQLKLDDKIISDGATLAITQKEVIKKLTDEVATETSRKEKWRLGALTTGGILILILVL